MSEEVIIRRFDLHAKEEIKEILSEFLEIFENIKKKPSANIKTDEAPVEEQKVLFGLTNEPLSHNQALAIYRLKDIARELYTYILSFPEREKREFQIAMMKLEECVMWAVKGMEENIR